MPNIGAPELIIILVIALLILGPGKLPEVGASIGKSIREFRKASSDVTDSMKVDTSPLPPPEPREDVPTPAATVAPTAATPTAADQPGAPTAPTTPSSGPRPSEPTPGTH